MGRMITLVAALAVTVAACSAGGGSTTGPAATPAPATATVAPTEARTEAPATPEPSAPAVEIPVAVAWDGEACTYTGPTDIPRGARMTFTMTNTPKAMVGSVGAALIFFRVDDGITASDLDAWKASIQAAARSRPGWTRRS